MGFTVAKVSGDYAHMAVGNMYAGLFDLTFDNSYGAGGESVTAAAFGMRKLLGMQFVGGNAASGKLSYAFDTTNLKILAFFPTGGKAGTAPTALADPITASGAATASAVDATRPTLVPGQAQEVGATADLSTITIRVVAYGN